MPSFCHGSSRKTLQDELRNEVIKENVMVRKTTDQRTDEKRLTWCGHVRRTEDHRLQRQAPEWSQ